MNALLRRLTPAGRLLLAAAGLTALFSLDTDRSTAYQAFAFLAALLALAALAARAARPRLYAERLLPRVATAGAAMPYRLRVGNAGLRTLEGLTALEPSGPSAVPSLPPGGSAELELSLLPARRGRLTLGPAFLALPDPLGLVNALTSADAPGTVTVLPKRYPLAPLCLPGARKHQPGGVALASAVGDSQEFMSLRDYRPGDPLRRIHWRSWAKAGTPIVREDEDEYFVRHALVLDTFGPASPAFEEAVSVAASFACGALTQESLLDLLFVGERPYCFTAGRGLGGPEAMLEALAGAAPAPLGFDALWPAVARRAAALSGCVAVLLGFDEERRAFVRRLEGLGLPVLALAVVEPGAPAFDGARRLEVGRVAEGLARL